MSSQAQFAANRANSQRSTGPKSDKGKAKSALNAVKTGLTGATVLLPSDDVAAYERHIASSFAEWNPATDRERVLVQSIADTEWRPLRIPSRQSGITPSVACNMPKSSTISPKQCIPPFSTPTSSRQVAAIYEPQ